MIKLLSLYIPDLLKPFILHTDVSLNATGAYLAQCDAKNNENPIAFLIKNWQKLNVNGLLF